MYKQQIIKAIQDQEWLKIAFQRKKDDDYVTRVVAPYDVFPQEDGEFEGEDRLLGYTRAHEDFQPGVITFYLNEIISVTNIEEQFDGQSIRRLINPKRPPRVSRNW